MPGIIQKTKKMIPAQMENQEEKVNVYLKRSDLVLARERGAKYGPLRNILSLKLKEFFNLHPEYDWFIDNGTLLAAYREQGKMIPHDDDFDIGLIFEDYQKPPTTNSLRNEDYRKTKLYDELQHFLVGTPYKCRKIKLDRKNLGLHYTEKIEVFDASYGHKPLKDTNYHHVTSDIQLYTNGPRDENAISETVITSLHCVEGHMRCPLSSILPVGKLQYEGEWYNTPGNPKAFLQSKYGYLGKDARFNETTGMYEKAE